MIRRREDRRAGIQGCAATGTTRDEVIARMRAAIALHLQGMREDGEPIPQPKSDPAWVEVSLPASAVKRHLLPAKANQK